MRRFTGTGLPWLSSAGFGIRIRDERLETYLSTTITADMRQMLKAYQAHLPQEEFQMGTDVSDYVSFRVKLPTSVGLSICICFFGVFSLFFLTAQQISAFPPGHFLLWAVFSYPESNPLHICVITVIIRRVY